MDNFLNAPVVDRDGAQGTIVGVSEPQITGDYDVLVGFPNGHRLAVPARMLEARQDGSFQLPFGFAEVERAGADGGEHFGGRRLVVPVIQEELEVQKRVVEKGRVRVTKTVHAREEVVDEPLMEEEVAVKRVAVNQYVESPPPIRQEGETMIIPLLEEVLVVEKRLMLKAELHVTKREFVTHKPQRVVLRSEEATIERLSGGAAPPSQTLADDAAAQSPRQTQPPPDADTARGGR